MAATEAGKPFSINSFRSKGLQTGGARPSLFEISWTDTANAFSMNTEAQSLLVKAGSIPTANIAPLAVNYGGRAYKLQGFRTFDVWTVTVLQDEDFTNRNNIINWMQKISGSMDGSRVKGTPADPNTQTAAVPGTTWNATGTATVKQYGKDGVLTQIYEFINLWPTELAEIPLDWASDQIEEYTVSFAYDYWTHGTTAAKKSNIIAVGDNTGTDNSTVNPTSAT